MLSIADPWDPCQRMASNDVWMSSKGKVWYRSSIPILDSIVVVEGYSIDTSYLGASSLVSSQLPTHLMIHPPAKHRPSCETAGCPPRSAQRSRATSHAARAAPGRWQESSIDVGQLGGP